MSNYRKHKRINNKIQRSLKKLTRYAEKSRQNQKKIAKRQEITNMARSLPMDDMNGVEFEFFLVNLYERLEYKVLTTGQSGDFGADLIIQSNTGKKKIIQAKRYSSKVGIRAVQEVSSAKKYYNINNAAVITNNYFTEPAIKLALANNVKLIDRDKLNHLISKSKQKKTKNNISHKSKPINKKGFLARLFNI